MPLRPVWLTRIELDSMAPTLRNGQLVWTVRPRRERTLRRGAIVVVGSLEVGRRVVKRVVGLPGEHVRLDGHQLWVDGQLVDEPYATPCAFRGDFEVAAGRYLLLGDNRGASEDSRSWRQPYVARSEIAGVVLLPRRSPGRHPDRSEGPRALAAPPGHHR